MGRVRVREEEGKSEDEGIRGEPFLLGRTRHHYSLLINERYPLWSVFVGSSARRRCSFEGRRVAVRPRAKRNRERERRNAGMRTWRRKTKERKIIKYLSIPGGECGN